MNQQAIYIIYLYKLYALCIIMQINFLFTQICFYCVFEISINI